MKPTKTVRLEKDIEENEKLSFECFTIVFHHEYKINGERVKVDAPKKVQCIMPSGDFFALPRYDTEEIVRMLTNKLIEDFKKEW